MKNVELTEQQRLDLWNEVVRLSEAYGANAKNLPIMPNSDPFVVRSMFQNINFNRPQAASECLRFVAEGLKSHQIHFSNPGYMGVYVPHPTFMSVVADALSNAFNCQLATWRAAPFAVELEQFTLREVAREMRYAQDSIGVFTSGGSEANHMALILSMVSVVPFFKENGLVGVIKRPVIYVSKEAHHSIHKSVVALGLGTSSLREIPTDSSLKIDPLLLEEKIIEDLKAGHQPAVIVATAGTPSSGAIDPLTNLSILAKKYQMWLHVDAAYGGGCAILPELEESFTSLKEADSVSFDPHKLFSISTGCGIFFTRHRDILRNSFQIDSQYVPPSPHANVFDPFVHSLTWSRRFLGLKLFLSLATSGWSEVKDQLRYQIAMASLLSKKLVSNGWTVVAPSELPVICFVNSRSQTRNSLEEINAIAKATIHSGEVFISVTRISESIPVLRASIINRLTSERELDILIQKLDEARNSLSP